ncbi:hypothetical protein [Rhodovastum atsumiense]|uniref:Transposase n=1 Tax=Rhodovastum atsumiense TaxID=504468 RepID=A0A5M6IKA5_9PROT|nr:hypothetical protein [Rhodovastum atsumiense]KAA5608105.1 hypothetical protein F1189_30650 [Rhodovastum atsumiense]
METSAGSDDQGTKVMEIAKPADLRDIANLGLNLAEAKELLAAIQREVVAAQAREHAVRRPTCRSCGGACHIKDYRQHRIATLFGQVTVRLPRFRCGGCGEIEGGVDWPSHCRSAPELDRLQAHLSALMTYRVAAGVLEQMFPIEAGRNHETLRRHTMTLGEQLRHRPVATLVTPAAAISISVDSTFIRSCEEGERHLEVKVGNVETEAGSRQVFGAVTGAETNLVALIGHRLDSVGRTGTTALTGFTDGCAGLRSILVASGVAEPPILDWFHISMRLQQPGANRGHLVNRHTGTARGEGGDRDRSRPAALASVERQGQGCSGQYRAHPQSHARVPGGSSRAPIACAVIAQAVDCIISAGRLSGRSGQLDGQLR